MNDFTKCFAGKEPLKSECFAIIWLHLKFPEGFIRTKQLKKVDVFTKTSQCICRKSVDALLSFPSYIQNRKMIKNNRAILPFYEEHFANFYANMSLKYH